MSENTSSENPRRRGSMTETHFYFLFTYITTYWLNTIKCPNSNIIFVILLHFVHLLCSQIPRLYNYLPFIVLLTIYCPLYFQVIKILKDKITNVSRVFTLLLYSKHYCRNILNRKLKLHLWQLFSNLNHIWN